MTRISREAFAAFCLAIFSGCAYLMAHTPELRSELHYVTQGASLAVLAGWLALHGVACRLARVMLWWIVWEQSQVAFCGIAGYGIPVPLGSGLCAVRWGEYPYLIGCLIALYYLWRARREAAE